MSATIRFCLALHNHQPIGNFDGVIEQAYQDSYKPFLDVLDHYPHLRMSLHTSGSLMEWLEQHRPEYVDRLANLVAVGRLEIIGGAYYEPILAMLPRRDRIGQIRSYSQWLENRLGGKVRGMWIPERVWEPAFVSDLSEAGIEYTILDDFHFKNAGLTAEQLHGYFVSEDEGRLLKVFPGSEPLRYLIPFGAPDQTIELLRQAAERHPQAVVVFGDDGEKFGTWPETKKHVYDEGWLYRFFDALSANQSWLQTCTLSEAVDQVSPSGKIYLPDASYREMTEWSLPVEQLKVYEHAVHEMEHDPRWPRLQRFVRGGFWRNFKVKYPESDEMYCRMLQVSKRLEQAEAANPLDPLLESARTELYRGQCNCSYWHGAFGGIYLPHLRHAVYNHLIAADNLLDRAAGRDATWAEAKIADYNLDARQEVMLATDRLLALMSPSRGGHIYELDARPICLNLLASLARRPEAYHQKVLAGANAGHGNCASIHDRVVFKQADLDQRVCYDWYPRKALVDHFYTPDVLLADVAAARAQEAGDFVLGVYDARLRRNPDRVQVQMSRRGRVWDHEIAITKTVTLQAGGAYLEIAYLLEELPPNTPFHFGIEYNFAGLPSGAHDRYFFDGRGQRLGHLGAQLDLHDAHTLGLADEWQGVKVELELSKAGGIWAYPVETVSQSEGGFELVHQAVCVEPHWMVQADALGQWSVVMRLGIDTSLAESRMPKAEAALTR